MKQHTKWFKAAIAMVSGLAIVSSATSAAGQTVLVDFGNNTSFRGTNVVNPDVNGHYWNSLQPGLYYADMIDTANAATTIDLGFDTPVSTDSYNGPAGDTSSGLATVANTDIDAAALGNLGITNAAYDYAAGAGGVCKFQIQGLDLAKKYNLTFYGSHKFNSDSNTVYSVYSDSAYTTLIGRTNLNVWNDSPWLHNRDRTVTISNLTPPGDSIFYVSFVGSAGGDGYLNDMQISVVQPISVAPKITSQSYNPITHQFTLVWTSSQGNTYTVESSATVTGGFSALVTGIPSGGSSTTNTVTLTGDSGFLRILQE